MRRLQQFAIGAMAVALLAGACDSEGSTKEGEEGKEQPEQALKLVIPSHESTPRVDLTYKVEPLEKSEVGAVKEAIGNAIYLSLRSCEKLHPPKEEASVVAVEFDVEGGSVTDTGRFEPKIRGEAKPVGEAGHECVLRGLKEKTVDLPEEKFGERRLHVTAQAKLFWEPLE